LHFFWFQDFKKKNLTIVWKLGPPKTQCLTSLENQIPWEIYPFTPFKIRVLFSIKIKKTFENLFPKYFTIF
jgi:hypothetical protein